MSKKVAVVTAASKGMGAACATELAQRGYNLVLMSRSHAVLELADTLQGIGLQGDVTNPDDLERVVVSAFKQYGRIDAVVNNTGHPAKGDLLGISDQEWHHGLDLLRIRVHARDVAVPRIREQAPPDQEARLDVLVADLARLLHPVGEALVRVPHVLQVDAKLHTDRRPPG